MVRIAIVGLLISCRTDPNAFRREVEPKIVSLFCADQEPHSYYRTCFEVTEPECRARMTKYVGTCFDKLVPSTIDKDNAAQLTERLGSCAGDAYEAEEKPIVNDACKIARDAYVQARKESLGR